MMILVAVELVRVLSWGIYPPTHTNSKLSEIIWAPQLCFAPKISTSQSGERTHSKIVIRKQRSGSLLSSQIQTELGL